MNIGTLVVVVLILGVFVWAMFDIHEKGYESGYEQGVWDSAIYSNYHFGERGLMSGGFREYLKKTKPDPQTTEEIWKIEDIYLGKSK